MLIRVLFAPEARRYSPDQPRDDHGRFGEGGGTAVAELEAAPVVGPLSKDGANDQLMQAGMGPDGADLMTDTHDVYRVGETTVVMDKSVAPNLRDDLLGTASVLQSTNPLQGDCVGHPYMVFASDAPFDMRQYPDGVGGFTSQDAGVLAVRPVEEDSALGRTWQANDTNLMPIASQTDTAKYNLAHEWGHAIANGKYPDGTSGAHTIADINRDLMSSLSSPDYERDFQQSAYANTSAGESYAEQFAQFTLGGEMTTFGQALADHEGWVR